jgi:sugar diacid utilization regulator
MHGDGGSVEDLRAGVRGLLEHGLRDAVRPDHSSGDDPGGELDYALDGWHVGVIAVAARAERDGQQERAGQPGRAVRELAARVDCRLLCVEQDERSVWAWLGADARFALAELEQLLAVAGSARRASAPALAEGVLFAFGEPARGFEGWRLTHRQAHTALVVAGRRPRPCTRYGDVALLASAFKDELLAGALLDVYLAPLRDARDGGAALRQTLRSYLATERSISSTAAALGVVRKTVENRLQTIEERLGRTLHPFPAELEIALLLDELGE